MTVKVVQGLGIRALTTYKELLDSLRSLAVRLFGASCWRTLQSNAAILSSLFL